MGTDQNMSHVTQRGCPWVGTAAARWRRAARNAEEPIQKTLSMLAYDACRGRVNGMRVSLSDGAPEQTAGHVGRRTRVLLLVLGARSTLPSIAAAYTVQMGESTMASPPAGSDWPEA